MTPTRLKFILAAAAVLIIGGVAVGVAVRQARIAAETTCREWRDGIDTLRETMGWERAFLAVKGGAVIPKAIGDKVLGDCTAGVCTIAPDDCPNSALVYQYTCGPLVDLGAKGSWRLCEVRAPKHFLGAWKAVAASSADFMFWPGFGAAVAACKAHTTAAKCLALFDADKRCWLLTDGRTCDNGRMYGPGLGGSLPCSYALVKAPMPCVVDRGAGSEIREAELVLNDEEIL